MEDGNSKKIVNKKKEIQEYVARISWPLLLSEKELDFLRGFLSEYTTVEAIKVTDQIKEFLLNTNHTHTLSQKKDIVISLFGINFSGRAQNNNKEGSMLSRVIVSHSRLSQVKVSEIMKSYTIDRASILFVALISLCSKPEMKIVTISMVREKLNELLLIQKLSNETLSALHFFDYYYLGKRQEKFFFPEEDGSWLKKYEINAQKVYQEDFYHIFSVMYYLQSHPEKAIVL